MTARLRLFALHATAELGNDVAAALGQPLAAHEERDFEDGEHKTRPLDGVAGCDVYVVQSLHGGPAESASDKLVRLLFFIGALKDAGAARVTAVTPYLAYARKDRRTKPNDPVTTRYVAQMFEAVGADLIVTLDVHNPAAFENAFRIRTVALTAAPLFVDYAKKLAAGRRKALRGVARSRRRQARRIAARGAGGRAWQAGRQGLCRKAPQRRRGQRRHVRGRGGGRDRADRRRPDQHRRHAVAGGAKCAQGRRQTRARHGHARAVHAGRGASDRRSGYRPFRRHRQRAAVPARCLHRSPRSTRCLSRLCWRRPSAACTRGARSATSWCFSVLFAHDLFRKPVPTFRDHARCSFSSRTASAAATPKYSRARRGHFSGVRGCGSSMCAMVSRARKVARWQR